MVVAEHETLIETREHNIDIGETLISVIVTLFNYEGHITSTLDDVAAQTYKCLDLVIVDDCSSDNSAGAARDWIAKNHLRFSSTRLVRHRVNQGLAQSRNTAFALAESEYIFVMDSDNGIYPRAIARLFEALRLSGQDGAYSQLEMFGDQTTVGFADIWDPEHFRAENYIDAMALVTKSAWRTVGGYSYMDVVGWEDFDFWCKFVEARLQCVYVPELLCRYRVHGKSMLRTETTPRRERLCQEMVLRHPWITFTFEGSELQLLPRELEYSRQEFEQLRRSNARQQIQFQKVQVALAQALGRSDALSAQRDEIERPPKPSEKDIVERGNTQALAQLSQLACSPKLLTKSLFRVLWKGERRAVDYWQRRAVAPAASTPVEIRSADREILTRLPFFDRDEYLKVNSDVAHAGMDPLEHYCSSGRAEHRSFISSIGAARVLARYNHCDDAKVRFPYLRTEETAEFFPWAHLRVAVLTASRGNYYMDEIAEHVCHGLTDLGVSAFRNNETFQQLDAIDYAIIIAPHEFFNPDTPEFWKTGLSSQKVSVLNTEQLQTPYFARSLPYILQARKVIDLNYQMAAMFQDAAIDTFFYVAGYVKNSTNYPQSPELPRHPLTEGLPKTVWDYSLDRDDFAGRPIDITFIAKASPLRNEFLARNSTFFASRLCQIVYRQRNQVMPGGSSIMTQMPRVSSAIGRRSKVVLNIHRDAIGYFEWMRIVNQGIWQKAAVVSNPCLAHPIFKAGQHYFEESLSRIPKLLAWLLDTEEGRAEADRVRRAAFETLVQCCPLQASSVALLRFLQRQANCQPHNPILPSG
jgi:hypothetical protein